MKKYLILSLLILLIIACQNKNQNQKNDNPMENENVDLIRKNDSLKNRNFKVLQKEIRGNTLDQYFPNTADLFKNKISGLAGLSIEKIDLQTQNGILVTMLHNISTSHEMAIYTHSDKLELIEKLYLGEGTMFDAGKSHTIMYNIAKNNQLEVHNVDYGYVGEDVDTLNYKKYFLEVNPNGKFIKKE